MLRPRGIYVQLSIDATHGIGENNRVFIEYLNDVRLSASVVMVTRCKQRNKNNTYDIF